MSSSNDIWKRSHKPTHLSMTGVIVEDIWSVNLMLTHWMAIYEWSIYLTKMFSMQWSKHVHQQKLHLKNIKQVLVTGHTCWMKTTPNKWNLNCYWSIKCTEVLYDMECMKIMIYFFTELNEIHDEILIATLWLQSNVVLVLAANVWQALDKD